MTGPEAVGPLALRVGQSATRSKTIAEADMSQTLTHHAPAYVGDTLTARVEVVSLKPDKPVCQLKFEITNQAGTLILSAEAWTYTLRPADEKSQTP